jgi:hypothetical protein
MSKPEYEVECYGARHRLIIRLEGEIVSVFMGTAAEVDATIVWIDTRLLAGYDPFT